MKIFVAGKPIEDSTEVVRSYILDHRKTAREFDLHTGTHNEVSDLLIKSTRIFSSRISEKQGKELIKRAFTAPWDCLDLSDCLADADPTEHGGLYDKGLELWNHFTIDWPWPAGIGEAKVSKVLHAMRPSFFPILDSRLRARYKDRALEMAREISDSRLFKYAYWAAIRRDLVDSDEALQSVRSKLKMDDHEMVRTWAKHVSDVRLHDVLAWSN